VGKKGRNNGDKPRVNVDFGDTNKDEEEK